MKITLDKAVVVEGRYDKIKLDNLIQCPAIVVVNGFAVYNDNATRELIRRYAATCGIIILTDSDNAGQQLRGYIAGFCGGQVHHAYLPAVYGKERRKARPSKTGIIGVEGACDRDITAVLSKFAPGMASDTDADATLSEVTKQDLYELGLCGGANSAVRRRELTAELRLPQTLGVNALLRAINTLCRAEFYAYMRLRADDVTNL